MDDMTAQLKDKKGDDFDKAFIEMMIVHHQGAIDMAKLAKVNAKLEQMKQWQQDWGYPTHEMMQWMHQGH